MNGSRIEPVSLERDLDAIAAIARASFARPWTRDMFAQELSTQPLSRSYVLRTEAGEVAAFCTCWLVIDELHINTIAVDPSHRRRGLARELLAHVLADARSMGARRALLEVRASNVAAIGLYEAFGFTADTIRKGYYPAPPEDALVLSRSL
jgi:ribosomal-protein-alanine N-acetyltransferase